MNYKNLFLNFVFKLPWFASVKDCYLTPSLFILRKQKSKHMSLLDFQLLCEMLEKLKSQKSENDSKIW